MALTIDPVTEPAPTPEAPGDWLTATVRPTGTYGRADTGRLRSLLQALSACASIVVVDLASARLRGRGAAAVIDAAAATLEQRGGCLLCVNVDAHNRACLRDAGDRAVVVDALPAPDRPRTGS